METHRTGKLVPAHLDAGGLLAGDGGCPYWDNIDRVQAAREARKAKDAAATRARSALQAAAAVPAPVLPVVPLQPAGPVVAPARPWIHGVSGPRPVPSDRHLHLVQESREHPREYRPIV